MAHRTLHYYGRGACRYGADELIKGTLNVKELKELYALKATMDDNDDAYEAYEDAVENVDDYFTVSTILEYLSEKDFLKVVNGKTDFVAAEEIWFGLGGTITKAKVGFAEGEFGG